MRQRSSRLQVGAGERLETRLLIRRTPSVSDGRRDAADNLALVLNILSPQEAEGRQEILTEMFSYYILMTKSIHRWARLLGAALGWSHHEGQAVLAR